MKDDNTDNGKIVAKSCDLLIPDATMKETLWAQINDANTTETLKDLTIKVGCFWQRKQQLKLLEPYFEKYYANLRTVVETRNREFAEIYMEHLSPAFMARDEDLVEFTEILKQANPEQEFFILFLKRQIETIDIIKRSRVLCQ